MWSLLLYISAAASFGFAQPDLWDMGPRLKVPDPRTHLFFHRQPVVVDGVMLVPLKALEGWLKTKATVDEASGEISIAYYGETKTAVDLHMWIGQARAKVAQAEIPLDGAPKRIEHEVFVPLRFIAEAVGVWVDAMRGHIRLKKPDLDWTCYLAIPPHPQSLEGKMAAVALKQRPGKPKRVARVHMMTDGRTGTVLIFEPGEEPGQLTGYSLRMVRDRAGWHVRSETPVDLGDQ